jgi:hypothetical protein
MKFRADKPINNSFRGRYVSVDACPKTINTHILSMTFGVQRSWTRKNSQKMLLNETEIISHGVVEKEKNEFNETRAQCTSTFFPDSKKPSFAREDMATLIIEHQRSRVKSISTCTSRKDFLRRITIIESVAACDSYKHLVHHTAP